MLALPQVVQCVFVRLSVCLFEATHMSTSRGKNHISGLMYYCSNPIANALELLQSCAKPSIYLMLQQMLSQHQEIFELREINQYFNEFVWTRHISTLRCENHLYNVTTDVATASRDISIERNKPMLYWTWLPWHDASLVIAWWTIVCE